MTEKLKVNEDDSRLLELAWRCCFLAQRVLPSDRSHIPIERLGAMRELLNRIAIPEEYNSESAMELYRKNAAFFALFTTLSHACRTADRLAEEKAREALEAAREFLPALDAKPVSSEPAAIRARRLVEEARRLLEGR